MISNCAKVIANWLEKNKAINYEDYELYYYASYSLLITMLPVFLALIAGGIMGTPINSLLVISPFMIIRKYSGGYHAKNVGSCMFFSIIMLCIFIWISSHAAWNEGFIILVLVAASSLCFFSPIESINKELSHFEKRKYKKTTVCLVVLFLMLIGGSAYLNLFKVTVSLSTGMILTASLQIPCIVQNFRKNIYRALRNECV